MIWRVRKVLGLQTKAVAIVVNLAALTLNRPIEKVAAVELQAGLGGQHLKNAPSLGFVRLRGQNRRAFRRAA